MSLRQAAIANNINLSTARRRIERGWDKIDAFILPIIDLKIATDEQIIECERLGLSIRRSAFLLGISHAALHERIEKLNINWRGKGKQIGVSDE